MAYCDIQSRRIFKWYIIIIIIITTEICGFINVALAMLVGNYVALASQWLFPKTNSTHII